MGTKIWIKSHQPCYDLNGRGRREGVVTDWTASSKFPKLKPWSPMWPYLETEPSRRSLRCREILRAGLWHGNINILVRKGSAIRSAPRRGRAGQQAKGRRPGRAVPPETNSFGHVILDFWLLKPWEDKCFLCKPPMLWYFTMAALGDYRKGDS